MDILRNITAGGERSVDLVLVCGMPFTVTAWVDQGKAFARFDISRSTEMKVKMGLYEPAGLRADAFDHGFAHKRGQALSLYEVVCSLAFDSGMASQRGYNRVFVSRDAASGQLDRFRDFLLPVLAEAANFVDMDKLGYLRKKKVGLSPENWEWVKWLFQQSGLMVCYWSSPRNFFSNIYNKDFVHLKGRRFCDIRYDRSQSAYNDAMVEYLKSKIDPEVPVEW